MMTMGTQNKVKKIFLLVPVLLAAVLMGFMFLACDVGDEPELATGPDTSTDPLFDENRPGINVRVQPSRVTVPDATGGVPRIVVIANYRDPAGMPVQGLQMNFTSDPPSSNFVFFPTATFTDGNGVASAVLTIGADTPTGSYTVVAYTSPASAGPNAKGYGTLYVTYVAPVVVAAPLTITTAVLPSAQEAVPYVGQQMAASGGTGGPYTWQVTAGNFPNGISMNTAGLIAGTPGLGTGALNPTNYPVTIQVSDGGDDSFTSIYYGSFSLAAASHT